MAFTLNLADLFASTFGYTPNKFDPQFADMPAPVLTAKKGSARYYGINPLVPGGRYFMPVTVTYPLLSNTGITTIVSNTISFDLPFPVISADAKKSIVKTDLTERSGTFKELINRGDWEILIQGLMIDRDNNFPEDDFNQLVELYRQDVPISIKSPLTDMLLLHTDRQGSDNVVIESINFPKLIGVQHVKAYELKLISDTPFNLELIA